MLKIEIKTGGAAYSEDDATSGNIIDINVNKVSQWNR